MISSPVFYGYYTYKKIRKRRRADAVNRVKNYINAAVGKLKTDIPVNVGICIGIAAGTAVKDIGLGLCLGVCVGPAAALVSEAFKSRKKRRAD